MSEEFLGIPDLEVIADPASQGLSSLNVGQEFGQPLIPVPQFERPEDFRDFVFQDRLFGNPAFFNPEVEGIFGPNDTRLEQRGDQSVLVDSVTGEPILNRFGNLDFSSLLIDPRDFFDSQVNTALANNQFQEVPRTRSEIEEGLRALQQRAALPIPASTLQRQVTQQPSDVIFGGEDSSDFLIGDTGPENLTLGSFRNPANPVGPPKLEAIQSFIRGEKEAPGKKAPGEEAPTPSFLQQLFRKIFLTGQEKDEQAGLPSLLDRLANFNFISSAMAGELPGQTPIPTRTGIFPDFGATQEAIQNLTRGRPVSRRENLTPQEQARARRIEEGKQATAEIRQAVGPEIYDKEQQLKLKNQAAIERFLRKNRYPKKKGGQVLKGRAMRSTNYNHQKFI